MRRPAERAAGQRLSLNPGIAGNTPGSSR